MPLIPFFLALLYFAVILIGLISKIWWILVVGIIGFLYQFWWVWKNSPWR